jgi:hypothetical protein
MYTRDHVRWERAAPRRGMAVAMVGCMSKPVALNPHSPAWVAQVWIAFASSIGATALGILMLPSDPWVKGFLGMGLLFTVGATLNLAKTSRDMYEAEKLHSRVDEARMEKLLVEHDIMK